MPDSPLLFPVRLEGGGIVVLDETLLPFREEYIEVRDLDRALWVLSSMKTRAFGQVLLFFYSCVLFRDKAVDEIASLFKRTRPTFDFDLLGDILKKQAEVHRDLSRAVGRFVSGFDALRKDRAERLAALLPPAPRILTICNVNGELIYLFEELRSLGKPCVFYVSETRPYLQGSRLTFWELRRNDIPSHLVCDNQAAQLMREGLVNCVVTGSDRSTTRGAVVNKTGTYALAVLARFFGIPFYALVQYPKDIDIEGIEIEERPGSEVFMFLEDLRRDIPAVYPAFDVVPAEFVTEQVALKP